MFDRFNLGLSVTELFSAFCYFPGWAPLIFILLIKLFHQYNINTALKLISADEIQSSVALRIQNGECPPRNIFEGGGN